MPPREPCHTRRTSFRGLRTRMRTAGARAKRPARTAAKGEPGPSDKSRGAWRPGWWAPLKGPTEPPFLPPPPPSISRHARRCPLPAAPGAGDPARISPHRPAPTGPPAPPPLARAPARPLLPRQRGHHHHHHHPPPSSTSALIRLGLRPETWRRCRLRRACGSPLPLSPLPSSSFPPPSYATAPAAATAAA